MTIAAPPFPVRYRMDLEQAEPDEARAMQDIVGQFDTIGETAVEDGGPAERHGKLRAIMRVREASAGFRAEADGVILNEPTREEGRPA